MSNTPPDAYAMKRHVDCTCEEAESRVRRALAEEGFGVLTEIDVSAVFANKLGVDFAPYKILGACNPHFAHGALESDADIGLLLPCNVVVYEGPSPGTSVVAAIDPVAQLGLAGSDNLLPMAEEVRQSLKNAVDAL